MHCKRINFKILFFVFLASVISNSARSQNFDSECLSIQPLYASEIPEKIYSKLHTVFADLVTVLKSHNPMPETFVICPNDDDNVRKKVSLIYFSWSDEEELSQFISETFDKQFSLLFSDKVSEKNELLRENQIQTIDFWSSAAKNSLLGKLVNTELKTEFDSGKIKTAKVVSLTLLPIQQYMPDENQVNFQDLSLYFGQEVFGNIHVLLKNDGKFKKQLSWELYLNYIYRLAYRFSNAMWLSIRKPWINKNSANSDEKLLSYTVKSGWYPKDQDSTTIDYFVNTRQKGCDTFFEKTINLEKGRSVLPRIYATTNNKKRKIMWEGPCADFASAQKDLIVWKDNLEHPFWDKDSPDEIRPINIKQNIGSCQVDISKIVPNFAYHWLGKNTDENCMDTAFRVIARNDESASVSLSIFDLSFYRLVQHPSCQFLKKDELPQPGDVGLIIDYNKNVPYEDFVRSLKTRKGYTEPIHAFIYAGNYIFEKPTIGKRSSYRFSTLDDLEAVYPKESRRFGNPSAEPIPLRNGYFFMRCYTGVKAF